MPSSHHGGVISIDPRALGPADPAYAQCTVVAVSASTKLVTVAGQIAENTDGSIPAGLKEQMQLCLSRIKACLDAAGGTVHDTTRIMYYFAEAAWEGDQTLDLLYEVLLPWLDGHRPASCGLVVKSMVKPEYLCEFEAQAVITVQD